MQESIKLPNYRMITCDDLTKRGDGHYDTQGQQKLGKRFAAAMIDLLNPSKAAGENSVIASPRSPAATG